MLAGSHDNLFHYPSLNLWIGDTSARLVSQKLSSYRKGRWFWMEGWVLGSRLKFMIGRVILNLWFHLTVFIATILYYVKYCCLFLKVVIDLQVKPINLLIFLSHSKICIIRFSKWPPDAALAYFKSKISLLFQIKLLETMKLLYKTKVVR